MPQGLSDLVGRAMIDPDFLAELQRTPDAVLAQYQLSDEERRVVLSALGQLGATPAVQRGIAFRTVLLQRLAT